MLPIIPAGAKFNRNFDWRRIAASATLLLSRVATTTSRLARDLDEFVLRIEILRAVIFGINDNGKCADIAGCDVFYCVCKKRAAELMALGTN